MFRKRSILINSLTSWPMSSRPTSWLSYTQQPQSSKPDFSELEKVVLANSPRRTAGVGIACSGDRLAFAKGFGVSNVETGAPVTPDMLFRLGSTTKMFTAAALVMLAEEGKLKLDEPIGKHAKGLKSEDRRTDRPSVAAPHAGLEGRRPDVWPPRR